MRTDKLEHALCHKAASTPRVDKLLESGIWQELIMHTTVANQQQLD